VVSDQPQALVPGEHRSSAHSLAHWEPLLALVLDGLSSPHSRLAYQSALREFFAWYEADGAAGFSKATVQRYRAQLEARGLAPSSINLRLAALKKLAAEAADNRLLEPEIAAAIARVRGAKRQGVRAGNWLLKSQAEQLLGAPDRATLKGKRDRALLGLLVGCGLRRGELAGLDLSDIEQREARWVIVDLLGKHGRVRTVPMPGWVKATVDEWAQAADLGSGRVLRALNKGGRISHDSMRAQSVFETVVAYGAKIGVKITPHDLRRTFAKLAHQGQAPLEQIQLSLGHASIVTTERYLGVRQDLHDAPCDRLGLALGEPG
jgi:integrase